MRRGKESKMFNGAYEDDCDPHDRVKYGVLNMCLDSMGIRSCASYGNSYMQLKGVRLRSTFVDGNSSASSVVATCEQYCHVLMKYKDKELRAVVDIALVGFRDELSCLCVSGQEDDCCPPPSPLPTSRTVRRAVFHGPPAAC